MFLLRNCAVYDGVNPERREGCDVLVEGNRIREVSDTPIKADGADVIDVGGRTLMPGLIDAHYHAIAAMANLALLDDMPRSLLAQYSRRSLEGALARGFTTLRDAGGADYGLARATERGLIRGPRLFYAGRALTQTGGHGDTTSYESGGCLCGCGASRVAMARVADGVPAVRHAARDELRKGATHIKIMASGGVASPSDPIDNLQYSDDEIKAIVWEAASWHRYVMAHAYTPQAIRRCVEFGVRSIEHANLIDAETARVVAEHDAFVVPTLVTYEALEKYGLEQGFPRVSLDKLGVVRAAGLSSLEHLKRAGVRMGFGTDLLGEMQVHQSREFGIRAEVMAPHEILASATSVNADLLQMSGQLGVVQADALADLLVVDGDPTRDLSVLEGQGKHIALIMKDGEIFKNAL